MGFSFPQREGKVSVWDGFVYFVEGAESYSCVPDGRFVVCCLKKTLPEVVCIEGARQLRKRVSAKEGEASAFLIGF